MRIVVIGGGAAGHFAAISARVHHPTAEVLLLERTDKVLAKVRISGGGRCNVTHHALEPRKLAKHYPRGEVFLRQAFKQWAVADTIAWFEGRGVALKTEADGRMFPVTDSSQTIIDALSQALVQSRVDLRMRTPVERLERVGEGWTLHTPSGPIAADAVIVASGGSPKAEGLAWLKQLGQPVVAPVPSLFTFNLPEEPITKLMGVVAPQARVRVEGTDLESTGPVLVTHWGLSGPGILRLSAWGARSLHAQGYTFGVRINWVEGASEEAVRARLATEVSAHPQRTMANTNPFTLPSRLWEHLLERAAIEGAVPATRLGRQDLNRLVAVLTNDRYAARGKTTYKEEFVTAGGVALEAVDPATMCSQRLPGLYFAGEVLDVDGITGGFNFQAAWTTGWIAGKCAATYPAAHTSSNP